MTSADDTINPPAEFWDWTTKNKIQFDSSDPASLYKAVEQWQKSSGRSIPLDTSLPSGQAATHISENLDKTLPQGTPAAPGSNIPIRPMQDVSRGTSDQSAPQYSGMATWFHYNPDGSPDPQDRGKYSAFGYDLDNKDLEGVAVPVDRLEAVFGKFTQRLADGTYAQLQTPEARQIVERIKGSSVNVASPDGTTKTFPIVDIQGSLKGHPDHVLDLTYGAGKALGLNDNAQVSYAILPGDQTKPVPAKPVPDQTSLVSRYKADNPETTKGLSNEEVANRIQAKYFPEIKPDQFQQLAFQPGGLKPIQRYQDEERSPIENFKAHNPTFEKTDNEQLTKWVWDQLSDETQKKWNDKAFGAGELGGGYDYFRDKFNPNPIENWLGHFFGEHAVMGLAGTAAWAKGVDQTIQSNPYLKQLKGAWEGIEQLYAPTGARAQKIPVYGPLETAYEKLRQKQAKMQDWIMKQAEASGQYFERHPPQGVAAWGTSILGEAVGGTPLAIASWAPFAANPALGILWGTLFDSSANYFAQKGFGVKEPDLSQVNQAGFIRAIQGAIFASPYGRFVSGFLAAGAGATTADLSNWLAGRKQNPLDQQVSNFVLDLGTVALLKGGPHSKPVQEEFSEAKAAQMRGDTEVAIQHMDRAVSLQTDEQKLQSVADVMETLKRQTGEKPSEGPPVEMPESWKPFAKEGPVSVAEAIKEGPIEDVTPREAAAIEKEEIARRAAEHPLKEVSIGSKEDFKRRARAKRYVKEYGTYPPEEYLQGRSQEAPRPEPPPVSAGAKIREAYNRLRPKQLGSAIKINDLARESGVPVDEVKRVLAQQYEKGEVNLYEGHWPSASEAERASAIEAGGRTRLTAQYSDIASADDAFISFNFGPFPFDAIRAMFADTKKVGEDLKELGRKMEIGGMAVTNIPRTWNALFRQGDISSEASQMAEHLMSERWQSNLDMNRFTGEHMAQSALRENFQFDIADNAKRSDFLFKMSKAEEKDTAQKLARGEPTGNRDLDLLDEAYNEIYQASAELDKRLGHRFNIYTDMVPGLVKHRADLEDIAQQLKTAGIDPEQVPPKEWNALFSAITNLKNVQGKEIELRSYNREDIMHAKLFNTFGAQSKKGVLTLGTEAGYIFKNPKGKALEALKEDKYTRVYGPGGDRYYLSPDAYRLWQNAYHPSLYEGRSDIGRAAGSIVRTLSAAKQRVVPSKLWNPNFHFVHLAGMSTTGAFTVAAGRALEQGVRLNGAALARAVGDELTFGMFSVPGRYKSQAEMIDFYRGRPSHRELTPQEKDWLHIDKMGGMYPARSEERELQFSKFRIPFVPQKGNRMANFAYNALMNLGGFRRWMFDKFAPALKLADYRSRAKLSLERDPSLLDPKNEAALRKEMRGIHDMIDPRYGELNWSNVFWDKTLKQTGIATMLSSGWMLGQWRMIGGAVHDLSHNLSHLEEVAGQLKEQGVKHPYARAILTDKVIFATQYMFARSLQNLIISQVIGGVQNPTLLDAIYPRIGKDHNGKDIRVKPPFWNVDMYETYRATFQEGGFHPTEIGHHLFLNKLSPVLSSVGDLLKNIDYAGNQIYHDNKWTNLAEQMLDIGNYFVGAAAVPMQLEQAYSDIHTGQFKLGLPEKPDAWAQFLGFGKAPVTADRSEMENAIMREFRSIRGGKIPLEEQGKRAAERKYREAIDAGDPLEIARTRQSALEMGAPEATVTRIQTKAARGVTPAMSVFYQLPPSSQAHWLREMSEEDRKIWWRFANEAGRREYNKLLQNQ